MLFEGTSQAVLVMLALSLLLPLASSFLAKAHWPGEVVGVLTALLSAIAGFVTQWAHADGPFDFKAATNLALTSFIVAVVGRNALWKATKTDAFARSHGNT